MQTDRSAVIAVDFQYECVSPDGMWPIYNSDQILKNAKDILTAARRKKIPVIYTKHMLEPDGSDSFRFEPRTRHGRPMHSLRGSTKSEICEEVAPQANDMIVEKQRWTGFYCTKMDLILRRLNIDHLIMIGIWTEACFETTVWDALWRDYRITIVKDACSTATDLMHMTSILDLANWLYGGQIIRTKEFVKALQGKSYRAWKFRTPGQFAYHLHNVQELYDSI